jgi:hypothetical protein
MIIKLDLESDLYQKIQEQVKQEKYSDLYEFIKIAVHNQILEETSGSENTIEKYEETSQNLQIKLSEDLQNVIEHINDKHRKNDHIAYFTSNLIWTFYNRFFPTKVIISTLASITTKDEIWFSLEQVREESFKFVEHISNKLRRFEEDSDLGRNEKLSTGLPLPRSEANGLKGNKKKKKLEKIIASEMRFKEQFVGRFIKKDQLFKGACFELGLVEIKIVNEYCLMRLSTLGAEFALLDNPILTNGKLNETFSKQETKFIQNKIFPKFKLENIIVKRILNELKNRKLSSNDIDEIYQNEMVDYITKNKDVLDKTLVKSTMKEGVPPVAERVATMGRLSELKLVQWDIVKGKSIYSLGKYA